MTVHAVRHRLRALLGLMLVVGLVLPAVALSREVRVGVDGAVTSVRTYAGTVAEALRSTDIELAAGDRVVPNLTAPLPDDGVIRIVRSITVEVDLDGRSRSVRGTFRTVGGALTAAGVVTDDATVVEPGPRTPINDGAVITVRSPDLVRVDVDDEVLTVRTHLETVGEVLASRGIDVDGDDLVDPPLDAPITDGATVVVRRVTGGIEVERIALPFTSETRPTDELFVGRSRVAVAGAEGERVDTYRLTFVEDEVTERVLVSSEVTSEPVTEVVEEGTVPRPSQTYIDDGSIWFDLAQCESGGRWGLDIGRFDGGLQFLPSTWTRWKRADYPRYAWMASPEQQIETATRLQAAAGWGQWPGCARKLGLL